MVLSRKTISRFPASAEDRFIRDWFNPKRQRQLNMRPCFFTCLAIGLLATAPARAADPIDPDAVIAVFSGSDLKAQKEMLRQMAVAWENDRYLPDDSPGNNRLMRFCMERIDRFDWGKIAGLRAGKQWDSAEAREAETAILELAVLYMGKAQGNQLATAFLDRIEREKMSDPTAGVIWDVSRDIERDVQSILRAKAAKRTLNTDQAAQLRMLRDIIRDQSYRQNKEKRMVLLNLSTQKELLELFRQDRAATTELLREIREQFPQLTNPKDLVSRRILIDLFTALAEADQTAAWLKTVGDAAYLSPHERNFIAIRQKAYEIKAQYAPKPPRLEQGFRPAPDGMQASSDRSGR
jgi:hypothetical protein